jgi:hypothetical protein
MHSCFCYTGFDTIARMSRIELILSLIFSKCQSYVQAKRRQKPFKSLEEKRNLIPSEKSSGLCLGLFV